MKKALLYSIACVALLTSCDMEQAPYGTLSDENAIVGVNDAYRYRNGFYTSFGSLTSGNYIVKPEIQADMFNAITIYGNRNGVFADGSITSANSDITSFWAGRYTSIASINYFIPKAEALLGSLTDEDDIDEVERYIGEAHFFRAFHYLALFDRFCQVYSSDKGDTPALGLPITVTYNPTGDRSSYPGRSTMNETIAFIKDELKTAYDAMVKYEKNQDVAIVPMASYLNSLSVKAVQARFALMIGDYADAATLSRDVIESNYYTLATIDNYDKMWVNDESDELILRPIATSTEQGWLNSTGSAWLSIYADRADYIPASDALYMYDATDIRFDSFFTVRMLNVNGTTYGSYVFNKYPGNPALKTSTAVNLMNMPKPLRLSEQYLILAEASYYNNSDVTTANWALNELRKNRHEDYENENFSGAALLDEIRYERNLELIGEGFRLSDLRRWKLGFERSYDYPAQWGLDEILVKSTLSVKYSATDYRYTWPIPADEFNVNPQIKGQQNPGY